jgi:hypothetical protein
MIDTLHDGAGDTGPGGLNEARTGVGIDARGGPRRCPF